MLTMTYVCTLSFHLLSLHLFLFYQTAELKDLYLINVCFHQYMLIIFPFLPFFFSSKVIVLTYLLGTSLHHLPRELLVTTEKLVTVETLLI